MHLVLIKLPKAHRPLVFLGPVIHIGTIIVSEAKDPFWLSIISNPILWISIFFYLNYKYLHDLFPFAYKKWMVILGFGLFYVTSIYPYTKIANLYLPKDETYKSSKMLKPTTDQSSEETKLN